MPRVMETINSSNPKSVKELKKAPKARFLLKHPLILPVAVFMLLFFVGLTFFVAVNGQTVGAADKHIVELFYDGKDQTVPTRAKTVADLLNRLNVVVGNKDIVEPALDTPIVEDNFKINVYRARTVEVIDGTNKKIVKTATKSPNVLAREAGLTLVREDAAHFDRPDDSLNGPIVAEKLIVDRSLPIQASLYGVVNTYRTRAKTIKEFLDTKNISLKQGETTQPANIGAPITDGLLVSVNLPGKKIASTEEPIAFTVQIKNNPALKAGQVQTVQTGVPGKRAVLYEVEVKDGKEISRKPLQTVVINEPTNEIREKGTQAIANYSVSTDKATLMAQAGIDPSQFAAVDFIISHESNWHPASINSIGCIGLGQRCPSSSGGNSLIAACPSWQTDPVCQLQHFSGYANGRYGSWQGAYSAWQVQHWW